MALIDETAGRTARQFEALERDLERIHFQLGDAMRDAEGLDPALGKLGADQVYEYLKHMRNALKVASENAMLTASLFRSVPGDTDVSAR